MISGLILEVKKLYLWWLGKCYCILGWIQPKQGIEKKMWFVPKTDGGSGEVEVHPQESFAIFNRVELGNRISST